MEETEMDQTGENHSDDDQRSVDSTQSQHNSDNENGKSS